MQIELQLLHQLGQEAQALGRTVGRQQALRVVGAERRHRAELPGGHVGVPSAVEGELGGEWWRTTLLGQQGPGPADPLPGGADQRRGVSR